MRRAKSIRTRGALCGAGAALLLLGAPGAAEAGDLFYTDWVTLGNENFADDQIWTVNFDGSGKTAITTPGQVQRPIGLTLDVANQHVYYAAGGAGAPGLIGRVNFDGTGNVTLVNGATNGFADGQHLRLDLTAGKIYWASYHDGLRRSNLDGSNVEVVQAGGATGDTRGPVHLANNLIYAGSPGSSNVYQSPMTAPGAFTESPFDIPGGNDMTMNAAGTRVFWPNANSGSIQSDSLAGGDLQTLVPGLSIPLGIAVTDDLLVWTERGGQRVAFANIDGTNVQTITTAGNPFGVAVVPEPGTVTLLALAGGALFMRRRRTEA